MRQRGLPEDELHVKATQATSGAGAGRMNKTVARIVVLGLAAGGLCGASVGFGLTSPLVGVGGAVAVGIGVAVLVTRATKRVSQ